MTPQAVRQAERRLADARRALERAEAAVTAPVEKRLGHRARRARSRAGKPSRGSASIRRGSSRRRGRRRARRAKSVSRWRSGRGASALFLDGPTNHLDLSSVDRLAELLAGCPGALAVVTHDAAFAAAVLSETWMVADGCVRRVTSCP